MVIQNYINSKPLHIASPDQSVFRVMSIEAFKSSSSADIQLLFSKQHIVVYGLHVEAMQFDQNGMQTLTMPSKHFTVQGILGPSHRLVYADI
jgi:hypothetical protein